MLCDISSRNQMMEKFSDHVDEYDNIYEILEDSEVDFSLGVIINHRDSEKKDFIGFFIRIKSTQNNHKIYQDFLNSDGNSEINRSLTVRQIGASGVFKRISYISGYSLFNYVFLSKGITIYLAK